MSQWMAPDDMALLLKGWRQRLEIYEKEIAYSQANGLPCDQSIGARDALRLCLRELTHRINETAIKMKEP